MEDDFLYWSHSVAPGIKIEEVFAEKKPEISDKLWLEIARQIFCEHGDDGYREILHFSNGAPVIKGYEGRVSITHCDHFFAAAFLPQTPDIPLNTFSAENAMGIDAENLNRQQVLKVRNKFLSSREQEFIRENDLIANIQAWTAKEAVLKASMNPAIDYKNDIQILSLPDIDENPVYPKKGDYKFGKCKLIIKNMKTSADSVKNEREETEKVYDMSIYSYKSESHCVTLAFSPLCKFF